MLITATTEYATAITDKTFRVTAERLVMQCGVRADLKGFRRLADAIIVYGTGLCTEFCRIYRIIGDINGLQSKTVMREITYAIRQSIGMPAKLSALVGFEIPETEIHSGLVIAYLGKLFKNPELSVYA